jgi:hypothetical protein
MSALTVQGLFDNSAPRETLRQQQIGNDYQAIAINLSLAAQAHCASRRVAIVANAYISPALECEHVRTQAETNAMRGATTPPTVQPECDRSKWKRAGEPTS